MTPDQRAAIISDARRAATPLLTDADRAYSDEVVARAPEPQQWQIDTVARVLDNIPARAEASAS